jgi:hypothetical protein
MKVWQLACALVALAIAYSFLQRAPVRMVNEQAAANLEPAVNLAPAANLEQTEEARLVQEFALLAATSPQLTLLKPDDATGSLGANVPDQAPPKPDLSYLAYYAYSEVPPDTKPADVVLDSLKDIPVGTPVEEIKRASDNFGLDSRFMMAVAKIESNFDPKQRTGSYIGLFQLSNYEFNKYGSGDINNPRDNAIAAAYKFSTAAIMFELDTHKKPTLYDLYLIHQQGTQGAAQHVSHPDQVAWKSMCATDEGRLKGEKWCKRAIWQNTLPAIKQLWKSVDNLTSGAFVAMWQERVTLFYSRYSEALTAK